jgi:hypothetical protein
MAMSQNLVPAKNYLVAKLQVGLLSPNWLCARMRDKRVGPPVVFF